VRIGKKQTHRRLSNELTRHRVDSKAHTTYNRYCIQFASSGIMNRLQSLVLS